MVSTFNINKLTNENNQIQLLLDNCEKLLQQAKKPIVLFGVGIIGKINLEYFKMFFNDCEILFCDNDLQKVGKSVDGIPVISFDELKDRYSDSYIIITSFQYSEEIYTQLKKYNLHSQVVEPSNHNIIVSEIPFYKNFKNYTEVVKGHVDKFDEVYGLLADELSKEVFYDRINHCISANNKYLIPLQSRSAQYFDQDILSFTDDEVFVDGGAYTGDTVEKFLEHVDGKFKKIYAFEPEKIKHAVFANKLATYSNIELVPYGLWDRDDILRFNQKNSGSSQLSMDGDTEIPVTSIDEVLQGEPVTFIKMDIEGAELEALRGAEKTIKMYKPKLAICVYHKPLDIVEIPLYIKTLVPEYKFVIRHYNNSASETVCYAFID